MWAHQHEKFWQFPVEFHVDNLHFYYIPEPSRLNNATQGTYAKTQWWFMSETTTFAFSDRVMKN